MKVRNGLFEKLSKVKQLNQEYEELLRVLGRYYEIADLENISNKHIIFYKLYIKKDNNVKILIDNNISQSTLTRYIKKFEKTAKSIIKCETQFYLLKEYINSHKL